jgi:hypothetical protein
MHVAVCSEKDRLIAALRDRIDALEKRLSEPIAVTVTLPKDFAVLQPALVSKTGKRKKGPDGEVLPPTTHVDLSEVDENNADTLSKLAIAKYGRRASSLFELNQWVRGIQIEVRAAKAARRRKEQKAREEPQSETEELLPRQELDIPVDEDDVPAHIRDLVGKAERGED